MDELNELRLEVMVLKLALSAVTQILHEKNPVIGDAACRLGRDRVLENFRIPETVPEGTKAFAVAQERLEMAKQCFDMLFPFPTPVAVK